MNKFEEELKIAILNSKFFKEKCEKFDKLENNCINKNLDDFIFDYEDELEIEFILKNDQLLIINEKNENNFISTYKDILSIIFCSEKFISNTILFRNKYLNIPCEYKFYLEICLLLKFNHFSKKIETCGMKNTYKKRFILNRTLKDKIDPIKANFEKIENFKNYIKNLNNDLNQELKYSSSNEEIDNWLDNNVAKELREFIKPNPYRLYTKNLIDSSVYGINVDYDD